ncbi:MAG: beta-ketoacyl-ACP synthase II [Dehalococcoidales bacterium]|nr:beta-ketoacyl-ACP synthase II [Dehalococcoidales bacterium]
MGNDNHNSRVVITGIGIISPLGLDTNSTWQALISGKSGTDNITLFDASNHVTKFAAEVKGFDPTNYIDRKEARRMDRFAQFAVAASKEAIQNSRLQIDDGNRDNIGVLVGSGIGGLITLSEQVKTLLEKGPDKVSPFLVPMMIADMASAQISITLGARGANFCATSACSSGSDAIGTAYEIIKRGDAAAMITGGAEAAVSSIGVAGFNSARALSTRNDNPKQASRPFDAQRDGFVLGEGAAVLIIEDLDYARRRGASILAEIIGYGASSDAYHITAPAEDGNGAVRAMKMAIEKAGILPSDIDYINAHGTSTPLNDKIETRAIKTVLGEHAYKIPVSSTKSMTGHMIGTAGAIEAAICVLTIQSGIIPPTINYTTPDPECDLDYVPNVARQAKIKTAMSNAFGFGGHNSVLIIRKYSEA